MPLLGERGSAFKLLGQSHYDVHQSCMDDLFTYISSANIAYHVKTNVGV